MAGLRTLHLAILGALFASFLAGSLHAEESYSGNSALLAIRFSDGEATAGMMCNAAPANGMSHMSIPTDRRSLMSSSGACRPSSTSILNPGILAFDVTAWSRQAIARLVAKINELGDPLNHDFTRMVVAGYRVREVVESRRDDLKSPEFDLGFGCYLLVRIPSPDPAPGT